MFLVFDNLSSSNLRRIFTCRKFTWFGLSKVSNIIASDWPAGKGMGFEANQDK